MKSVRASPLPDIKTVDTPSRGCLAYAADKRYRRPLLSGMTAAFPDCSYRSRWSVLDRIAAPLRARRPLGAARPGRAGPPAPPSRALGRRHRRPGAGLAGGPRADHQSLLPVGPFRVLVPAPGRPGRAAHHPPGGRVQRDRRPGGRRPARRRPALRQPHTAVGELDVHLALPFRAPDRRPALPLQPRSPLPHTQRRRALRTCVLHLRRVPARHRHRRRGGRPEPVRSGVRGRDRPGRSPLGRPGPARGGRGAGPAQALPVRPDRLPPGTPVDRPLVRQPADRPTEGHLARLLRVPARPVRLRAEPGQHLSRRRGAPAAGGDRLVRDPHQRGLRRAVLRRAVLRPRRAAHRTAHPLQKARAGLRDLRNRHRKETAR